MRRSLAWLLLAAAACDAELQAKQRTGQGTAAVSLDGCPSHVAWRDAPFPSALEPGVPNYVFWLRQLFTAEEATGLARLLGGANFSDAADTTDHRPSHAVWEAAP